MARQVFRHMITVEVVGGLKGRQNCFRDVTRIADTVSGMKKVYPEVVDQGLEVDAWVTEEDAKKLDSLIRKLPNVTGTCIGVFRSTTSHVK